MGLSGVRGAVEGPRRDHGRPQPLPQHPQGGAGAAVLWEHGLLPRFEEPVLDLCRGAGRAAVAPWGPWRGPWVGGSSRRGALAAGPLGPWSGVLSLRWLQLCQGHGAKSALRGMSASRPHVRLWDRLPSEPCPGPAESRCWPVAPPRPLCSLQVCGGLLSTRDLRGACWASAWCGPFSADPTPEKSRRAARRRPTEGQEGRRAPHLGRWVWRSLVETAREPVGQSSLPRTLKSEGGWRGRVRRCVRVWGGCRVGARRTGMAGRRGDWPRAGHGCLHCPRAGRCGAPWRTTSGAWGHPPGHGMGFCHGRPETTALQKCGSGFQGTDRKDSCSRAPSMITVVVCGPEPEVTCTDSTEGPCAKQARPMESPCFGALHSETKGSRCGVSGSGRQTGRVRPGPRGCSVVGEGQGVAGGSRGPPVPQMQPGVLPHCGARAALLRGPAVCHPRDFQHWPWAFLQLSWVPSACRGALELGSGSLARGLASDAALP